MWYNSDCEDKLIGSCFSFNLNPRDMELHLSQRKHLPVLNSCTWVFAATDTNHDGGEHKEEAGHGNTHTVHRLVAHNDITVDMVFDTRYSCSSLAKSWDL